MLAGNPEATIALDIPFRGERDYVHSTDLFAALDGLASTFLGQDTYLKSLTMRRGAHRQAVAQFRPDANAFGHFVVAAPGWPVEGWLVEGSAPITRRIAFDEDAIARHAISEQGRVLLPHSLSGSHPFEQLI